jgi:BetI-type transcriptional repressor, C-terminal
MVDNSHRADREVDPWIRLVTLIDRDLNAPVQNQHLLIELWHAGIWDAELRDHAEQHWTSHRSLYMTTVAEGYNQGAFTPTLSPEEVVDQLLAMLAGATVQRVLQFPAPSANHFRTVLLHQLTQMLVRA